MARFTNTLAAALLLAGTGALAATPVSAAPFCPASESFFGTIVRASGNDLTVRTSAGRTATVLVDNGARVNADGNALQPGTYIGAYGCVTPNGVFHANEVTLSSNASAYDESLSGIVRSVQNGRLIVAENGYGTGIWYVPNADDYRVGQTVSATGMRAANGAFYPQTIGGRNVAFDPDDRGDVDHNRSNNTITLYGVVQRVGTRTLAVWEPGRHETGTWIVADAGRFRVGERITGTGTEDRYGHFYPSNVILR